MCGEHHSEQFWEAWFKENGECGAQFQRKVWGLGGGRGRFAWGAAPCGLWTVDISAGTVYL